MVSSSGLSVISLVGVDLAMLKSGEPPKVQF